MQILLRVFSLAIKSLAQLLDLLLRALTHLGRYWVDDMRRRRTATGKIASFAIGMFAILCACAIPIGMLNPEADATRAETTVPERGSSASRDTVQAESARASATEVEVEEAPSDEEASSTVAAQRATTALPLPTATLPPTLVPTATVPAPPVGQVAQVANLRSFPRVAADTALAKLCPGDALEYVSMQRTGDELWFRVRVAAAGPDCDPQRAPLGSEGWAAASVVAQPSYDVRSYAEKMGFALPTTIPATAVPTRVPTARPSVPQPVAPQQRCDPSYPDFCLPPGIADLDCGEIPYRRFRVVGSDPHGFDRDRDGIGCES